MSAPQITNLEITPISNFVEDWHVRVTWIAFMTLWVFWGLIWIVNSYFVGDVIAAAAPEGNAIATDAEVPHKTFGLSAPAINATFAARIGRGHQTVKDALFSLLCLLSLNTFARASTYAVMILAWFYVAFAVVWFLAELVIDSRIMRVTYTLIFYALGLAIAGLAYKQGFF
jgi:hypothetical protein